jgi:hypothetical protein
LEAAQVLPGTPGSNKPIVARFYNRFLCFKKMYATKTTTKRGHTSAEGGTGGGRPEDKTGEGARSMAKGGGGVRVG